jgi:hypothetical protein
LPVQVLGFRLLRGTFNDLPIGFTTHQQMSPLSAEEFDLLQTWPGASQILIHHAGFQILGHVAAHLEVNLWVGNT